MAMNRGPWLCKWLTSIRKLSISIFRAEVSFCNNSSFSAHFCNVSSWPFCLTSNCCLTQDFYYYVTKYFPFYFQYNPFLDSSKSAWSFWIFILYSSVDSLRSAASSLFTAAALLIVFISVCVKTFSSVGNKQNIMLTRIFCLFYFLEKYLQKCLLWVRRIPFYFCQPVPFSKFSRVGPDDADCLLFGGIVLLEILC